MLNDILNKTIHKLDKTRPGWPSPSRTDKNVAEIHALVLQD